MDVKANISGSFHDARILRESPFFHGMENGQVQGLILGDSAYPLRRWLLTPFRAPGDQRQERFNVAHARKRVGFGEHHWHFKEEVAHSPHRL